MDFEGMEDIIRSYIRKAVIERNGCRPKFYVISGSHLYGFPSQKGGDIDVRGFHLAPKEDFFKLKVPREQIIINQDEVTPGFEQYPGVEVVSYELRKFGKLMSKMTFTALEWVFSADRILIDQKIQIKLLGEILKERLPGKLPYSYAGMGKEQYNRYLNPTKDSYNPNAKSYLYALRGLLAARYVKERKQIEPDVSKLAEAMLSGEEAKLIRKLIATKRKHERAVVEAAMGRKAKALLQDLLDVVEVIDERSWDGEGLQREINNWMLELRDQE